MGYMTRSGIAALQKQTDELRSRICVHGEDGNGDYRNSHNAEGMQDLRHILDDQLVVSSRYNQSLTLLAHTQPAPTPTQTEHVVLGHLVKLSRHRDDDSSEEVTYLIGGPHEPPSYENIFTVATDTPLGRRLLNKEVGDTVEVKTERGPMNEFTILEISVPGPSLVLKIAS